MDGLCLKCLYNKMKQPPPLANGEVLSAIEEPAPLRKEESQQGACFLI